MSDTQTQIIDAFNFRHATKVFDPNRKVPEDQFNTILESARLSPSSFGFEPWQLLIIQSPEKRELFREFSWGANGSASGSLGQLGTTSHFCIFLAHTDATMKNGSAYLQKHLKEVKQFPDEVVELFNGFYKKFQEHDFKIEGKRQTTDWSTKQAYLALGNMMTAAALMKIDSCPMEGFDMDQTSQTLKTHFGIDPNMYHPAVMVAFGYRADEPMFPKTRRKMEEVVAWF